MSIYNIGDRVEVVRDGVLPHHVGRAGEVVNITTAFCEAEYGVRLDGMNEEWDYLADDLRLTGTTIKESGADEESKSMDVFELTDIDGDELYARLFPNLVTGEANLVVKVNGEIVNLGARSAEFRDWLNSGTSGKPRAPKDKVDASEKEPGTDETAAAPDAVRIEDKLRLLADVVDGQVAFGTEMADFKRRLQIVLGLQ